MEDKDPHYCSIFWRFEILWLSIEPKSFSENTPQSYSAIATLDCVAWRVEWHSFNHYLHTHTHIATTLIPGTGTLKLWTFSQQDIDRSLYFQVAIALNEKKWVPFHDSASADRLDLSECKSSRHCYQSSSIPLHSHTPHHWCWFSPPAANDLFRESLLGASLSCPFIQSWWSRSVHGSCKLIVCWKSDGNFQLKFDMIKRWDYPAELHDVITADGYILNIFRIRHGRAPQTSGFLQIIR